MRHLRKLLPVLVFVCCSSLGLAQEPQRIKLVVQTGHAFYVSGVSLSGDGVSLKVALSCDGKYVVTGSYDKTDKTATLWDAASGKQLRTFKGHAYTVTSVALSGDGTYVVTGSNDKTAILWEAASRTPEEPSGHHQHNQPPCFFRD
jgi:WD40 repeat protein